MSLIHQQNFDVQGMCVVCVMNLEAPIPAHPPIKKTFLKYGE